MATYKEQIEIAKSYRMREGGYHRGDCPFCSGRHTFTIRLENGVLSWGCFRASCDVHYGTYTEGLSTAGIHLRAGEKGPSAGSVRDLRGIPIPVLTAITNQPQAMSYLKQMNALPAFEAGLISIKYAPAVDRIMFPVYEGGRTAVGYTGRARKGVKPKWQKFGDCSPLLTCGTGKTAVVVEDALSACAVGILPEFTGCALLGTSLTTTHIVKLRDYEHIMVALDPDARALGLNMTSRLGSKAILRLIPNDLKYYAADDVREILNDDYDEDE